VLQNEIPEAVNVALADAALHTGAWIILNAAPYRPMSQDFLSKIDCLILNRIEASEFFDTHIETLDDATMALGQIQSKFNRYAVVTLGSRGLVIAGPDILPTAIAPISVKTISSHGAGDCFTGVFATAIAKGRDVMTAGQHANKVAAQFVATAEHLKSEISFDLG
jgi:ribokinase